MEEFLTVAEIAELLKLNPQTIRNWIDRGEIPAVRLGSRRVRVRRSALEAFVAAGETAAARSADEQARPELVDAGASPWARLDAALAESRAAIADDDQPRLVETLNTLADAARILAAALSARQDD